MERQEYIAFTTDMSEAQAAIILANEIQKLPKKQHAYIFGLMYRAAGKQERGAFAAKHIETGVGKAMLTFINATQRTIYESKGNQDA